MILLYTAENRFFVNNIHNIMLETGYVVQLRNEFALGASGELPALDTWLEVWVDESDYAAAFHQLQQMLEQQEGADWCCQCCHEMNGSAFEFCWKCGEPDNS